MNIVIRPGSLLYFSGGIFMSKLLIVLFFIGGPMALTQLIYRLVDHKGNKTRKLINSNEPVITDIIPSFGWVLSENVYTVLRFLNRITCSRPSLKFYK